MLRDLKLSLTYNSGTNKIPSEFYIPVLREATQYDRAVGYFTISSLVSVLPGIEQFVSNGGKIRLVASPKLSKDDIAIIQTSYKMKNVIINKALQREIEENDLYKSKEFKLFSELVYKDVISIKIASMKNFGDYHEKIGIISDELNSLAFIGSANETNNAMLHNFESFEVFCDWENERDEARIKEKKKHFDALWNNEIDILDVMDIPEAVRTNILKAYEPSEYYTNVQRKNEEDESIYVSEEVENKDELNVIELRDYQKDAVNKWHENNNFGLLTMATGTGKTWTAIRCMEDISSDAQNHPILNVVVCPYQHLVEQWYEDLSKKSSRVIRCYSKYASWDKDVRSAIDLLNRNRSLNVLTLIVTNSSFVTSKMQTVLDRVNANILLVVDEVHNAGSNQMESMLNKNEGKFTYRLGLSATPTRKGDDESTSFIFDFFHGEVFNYGLKEAIEGGHLCPYYYHQIPIQLTEREYEKYVELTKQIVKHIRENKYGKKYLDDAGQAYARERARCVAGAINKLSALENIMKDFSEEYYNLIYCGATRIINDNDLEIHDQDEERESKRQIEKVCQLLGRELEMNIQKFTAEEDSEDRNRIIRNFKTKRTQAIVAIKCLDEGVNIPAIERAFILASSKNPKEYIQRRGRVLRKSDETGKKFATIYDFVTYPPNGLNNDGIGKSLVVAELDRVTEFAELSINRSENMAIINEIKVDYDIVDNEIEEDYFE
ncbi:MULTISPECIES: DEAD/DEAH box helicase family protein [unclassified Breznakia]|uniref:DEAD/DEAH box helicase family protein n=1 Tax=unclassified Breznakia TaxID=2623764 RepID=UPI002472FAD7|nr:MULTISPECIES: DEAD/DEAH box helicase family protein [unclassified Breznakia]MDH6367987.1 superfamily II DNA or RNA helicase [Breznakia sp. PH1-1]MDH6405082.1 superfamily II DNA or RNA helicase [Breznakia sp. PF1-11]MDH6412790.1 superfamily II DNA or RNA helicase [Breznakia sp. PFB1-11]MDH6415157.1 superfamily II DNA or RNA helicase [Breznakia sp. PFB1-14]MDH6417468.1 superfamily II DNA or RNA helicase [Breznakia sp. PFB1-4]